MKDHVVGQQRIQALWVAATDQIVPSVKGGNGQWRIMLARSMSLSDTRRGIIEAGLDGSGAPWPRPSAG